MKKRITGIITIIIFLSGLALLLYPSVSNYWNRLHQSVSVSSYVESVQNVDPRDTEALRQAAVEWNAKVASGEIGYELTPEQQSVYESLLQVNDEGVVGYVDIPAVDCTLPVYLGINEKYLQIAVGHLPWSSLPVGGPNTHCVISGHRGLPSARLFTDIDRLVPGDRFTLHVLDEVLTYEVDRINIVLPEEVGSIRIEEGGDYCTLLTCTPYGVNTHRLLVRGRRVETEAAGQRVHVVSEAMQISDKAVAAVLFVVIMLVLGVIFWARTKRLEAKRKKEKRSDRDRKE